MDNLSIEVGNGVHLRAASSYIRLQVFVLERSLALSDEFDQKDQSDTIYSVLFEEALPVVTARFLQEDERVVARESPTMRMAYLVLHWKSSFRVIE